MKTLKEIKEANKSILLYDENGYLVLTDNNVQTDEIVMEYLNKAKVKSRRVYFIILYIGIMSTLNSAYS